MIWHCAQHRIDLSQATVMGIVNVTPDSFSDGGLYQQTQAAITHGQQLLDDGADILDIGGESSRPGALPVDAAQELNRVLPVIEYFAKQGVAVSIDTTKPEVMAAAIAAGACIVNDINALQAEGAVDLLRSSQVGVVLMHKQGSSASMQTAPSYSDVVQDVYDFLAQRVASCKAAGIDQNRIVIDVGIGFGKTGAHNLQLLKQLAVFNEIAPQLLGVSRKKFISQITQTAHSNDADSIQLRDQATAGINLLALQQDVRFFRVHNVQATQQQIKINQSITGVTP